MDTLDDDTTVARCRARARAAEMAERDRAWPSERRNGGIALPRRSLKSASATIRRGKPSEGKAEQARESDKIKRYRGHECVRVCNRKKRILCDSSRCRIDNQLFTSYFRFSFWRGLVEKKKQKTSALLVTSVSTARHKTKRTFGKEIVQYLSSRS